MLKVWDGTDWQPLDKGIKYWTGSAWDRNNRSYVWSASRQWFPGRRLDTDRSYIVKWNVAGRTPPAEPDPTFPVPNVMGLTQAAAITALQANSLNVGDITYENTGILSNDGLVFFQSIAPLTQAPENTFVNIKVYEYVTPTVTMPNLNGLLKTQAESAVISLGLKLGPQDTIETYDTALIGRIVPDIQYPVAGAVVEIDTVVYFDYYIQKPYATMPQLVGQDEYSVYSLLAAVNLDPGTRTTIETTNQSLEGKVESQQYNAGQQLQTGTTVNYRVYIPNTTTTVPNIVGKTPAQASVLLDANELYLGSETTLETTNVSLEGTIAAQQYGAGTTRPVDTSVNYTLYIPNTTTTVPNIVNQTLATATSLLTTAELYLGYKYAETETSNTSLHNKIAAQSPASGSVQPVNSSVNYNLYVPLKTAVVPNIVGQTPNVAAGTLSAVGFSIGYQTSTTYTTNQAQVGQIASQSPASGTTQNIGTSVNYVTYELNPYTTVPNIVGQTTTNANTLLTNASLNVGSVTTLETTNSGLVGTVASQGTSSGSSVLRGTSINYVRYIAKVWTPVTVTRTQTVNIWSPTWQRTFYGSGNRRDVNTESLYFGRFSSTSTTGDQVSLINVNWSAINAAMTAYSGTNTPTITQVTFYYGLASGTGNSSKPVRFGYYGGQLSSMPSSISMGNVYKSIQSAGTQSNGSYYSINLNSTLRSMCFTNPTYPLVVNALDTNASSYGALMSSSTYFAITFTWQETTYV